MINGLKKLYQIKLLSPRGIVALLKAIYGSGINLATLLHFSAQRYPDRTVVVDDQQQISYLELYQHSQRVTYALQHRYQLKPQQRVMIIARNQVNLLTTLFACAQAGLDIYLVTTELSLAQYQRLIDQQRLAQQPFDFIIYEPQQQPVIEYLGYQTQSLATESLVSEQQPSPSIAYFAAQPLAVTQRIKRTNFGKITVLTAGSTGNPKIAQRKPSIINFFAPFYALLTKLKLPDYHSIFIATPVYHGFGLATVCMSVLLGKTLYFTARFNAATACNLIERHQIEVVTLVPLMLSRMLHHNAQQLRSLQCIISGSAPISSQLVQQTLTRLGPKLFNLYGTSEAGLCTLATPEDLQQYPLTIGKAIQGMALIVDSHQQPSDNGNIIGQLKAQCRWSVNSSSKWLNTGDIGYRDQRGYYYLTGRSDEMMISGGENVFPIELENILLSYPLMKEAYVLAIADEEFGQRLCAFIVLDDAAVIDLQEVTDWLITHAARYQQPKHIIQLAEIPINAIGKPDKQRLREIYRQRM